MKNSQKFLFVLKSKLAIKFALYIISIGMVIAFIISSIAIFYNYKMEIHNLKKELNHLEKSLKNSFVLNLWELNTYALKIMIYDLIRNKNIVYAKLIDNNGNIIIKNGKKPKEDFIKKEVPFYYKNNNKTIYLGKLVYYATTKNIYYKNKKFIIETIFIFFTFFGILSLIVIFLYWNTTIKYLLKIKKYTDILKTKGYKKGEITPLLLNRNSWQKDEIDELADSINNMHKEIVEKYDAIKYQSLHDVLTNLPNRRRINEVLKEITSKCKSNNYYGALFYVDLDDFKLINESIGHTTEI